MLNGSLFRQSFYIDIRASAEAAIWPWYPGLETVFGTLWVTTFAGRNRTSGQLTQ